MHARFTRMGMKRLGIIVICIATLTISCAKQSPRVVTGDVGRVTKQSEALTKALESYRETTTTMRALAWAEMGLDEEVRKTEAALVIARPTSLRIDAMDALADVWARAGTADGRLWLSLPAKRKLYSGRASRAMLSRLTGFDWRVDELVAVLAGSAPVPVGAQLHQVGPGRDRHFRVVGEPLHLWLAKRGGPVVRCARYTNDEREPLYIVTFSDHRSVGGVLVPHRIEALFPTRRARILVELHEVDRGATIERATFLPPSKGRFKHVRFRE